MDPSTLLMLGQIIAQMGGALGKASETPIGNAAAGIADVVSGLGASNNFANLMNKFSGAPAPGTAASMTQQAQAVGTTPKQTATPLQLTTGSAINTPPKVDPMDPTVKGYSVDPATGKQTYSFFNPTELSEIAAGNPTGAGKTQVPFEEALRRLK